MHEMKTHIFSPGVKTPDTKELAEQLAFESQGSVDADNIKSLEQECMRALEIARNGKPVEKGIFYPLIHPKLSRDIPKIHETFRYRQ